MNAMVPLLLNHLWQATIMAAAVLLVGSALGRYRPAMRFRLWTVGSLQFLFPLALLVDLGGLLYQVRPAAAAMRTSLPLARQLGAALFVPASSISTDQIASHWAFPWMALLLAAWACGTLAVLAIWLRAWLRMRALAQNATPLDLGLTVRTVSGPAQLELGVFGVLRPVLFVPEGLPQTLSAGELRAVLAHEMCHVRRRDNLWAALQMLVQAVFWFHPLVWWLGRCMARDRELACDEGTLRHGAQADEYATGLLKVCRHYMSAPAACMAGLSGSDLKRRVLWIAGGALAPALGARVRWLLALLLAGAVATPLAAGMLQSQAAASSPHFEVASIRAWGTHDRLPIGFVVGVQLSPGRVLGQCVGLGSLVYFAYRLTGTERVEGMPKWAQAFCSPTGATNAYLLQATMPKGTTADQARRMMQTLLARRFQFAAHWETRQMPVLALEVAKGGLKVKPSDPALDPPRPRGVASCPVDAPGCQTLCCGSTTMTELAGSLSFVLGRPVIDRTGVSGSYLLGPYGRLQWRGDREATSSLPALPTLLREQYGLDLKTARGLVKVLAITHAARPRPD